MQRQAAASTSTRPLSNGQHLLTAGSPRPIFTKPPNKSTHAPNFSVSIGHVAFPLPDGGLWLPGGGGHPFPPVAGGFSPGGRRGPTIGNGGSGSVGPTTGGMGSPDTGGIGSPDTGGMGTFGTVTGGMGSPDTGGMGSPDTGGMGTFGTVTGGMGSPVTGGIGSPETGGMGTFGTVIGGTGSLGTVTGGLGECFPPFLWLQEPHDRECWGEQIMHMRKRHRERDESLEESMLR